MSPKNGNSTVETPTDRGERAKRSQDEIRGSELKRKVRVRAEREELPYIHTSSKILRRKSNSDGEPSGTSTVLTPTDPGERVK